MKDFYYLLFLNNSCAAADGIVRKGRKNIGTYTLIKSKNA